MAADPFALVAARKASEMRAKAGALSDELAEWSELAKEHGPFEKHHSQILRLAGQFKSALAALHAAGVADNAADAEILAQARNDEVVLLELHRVWDFFRSKFLQRSEPYKRFLVVADELAWACYEPAIKRAKASRREPPLTFFSTDPSPYAIGRDKAYAAEIAGGPIAGAAAANLLKSLPVPVIGVPWFQSSHLPDLVMTAHEVGHHVEEDLRLTADLNAAVAAGVADAHRRQAWLAWAGELFADLYGTLALGPAFPVALSGFLSDARASIATEAFGPNNWGYYPTAYLRVLVSLEVLPADFKDFREGREAAWRQAFPQHAMAPFEADVKPLVAELLQKQFSFGAEKFRLGELISFSALSQKNVRTAMNAVFQGALLPTNDVRELVAAAAFAFDSKPVAFNTAVGDRTPQARILDHVQQHIQSGPRSSARLQQMQQSVAAWKASDQADGVTLVDRLHTIAALRAPKQPG